VPGACSSHFVANQEGCRIQPEGKVAQQSFKDFPRRTHNPSTVEDHLQMEYELEREVVA
jgi:hypothetical protein